MSTVNLKRNALFFTVFVFASGLLLRLVLAYNNVGFESDTACFSFWADRMYEVGPSGFYSPDVFTDYPPGYMYLLYPIGALRSLLQLGTYSGIHLLLLKLPAILCDLGCALLLYRETAKRYTAFSGAVMSAAYLFNPAVLLNSSVWGQVDSVYTLAVVFMCIQLAHKKLLPAYISFGLGVLIKPQMLIFTPVLLAAVWNQVFLTDFSCKKLLKNLMQATGAALGTLLLAAPFGLTQVISQYTKTMSSYPYATVNAYNFWAFLGFNWVSQDSHFLFLSCKTWGTVVIFLIVSFVFLISMHMKKYPGKYFLLAAFIILTMFVFSVRMHERYMFSSLILLLFCYILSPAKHMFFCYAGFSLLHFCNTAHILYYYDPAVFDPTSDIVRIVSFGMVFMAVCLYRVIIQYFRKQDIRPESEPDWELKLPQKLQTAPPKVSAPDIKFTRADLILLLSITLLYSFFALYDLGNHKAPVTAWDMVQDDSITLEFKQGDQPAALSYYIAPWQDRTFQLELPDRVLREIELDTVFTWKTVPLETANDPGVLRLTLTDDRASLLELVFTDEEGNIVIPENAGEYPALFDESNLYPTHSTFRDSMYFDEIYHARTAYEFINGLYTYENTHPPLGKIFIALGVWLFGMNPFGWRIIGTLFGIGMLPFLYLFGKRITGNTPAAAFSCFLFAFDFMHFTQTRIATIDVYVTFFVIVMYYFMYRYCSMSFYDTPLRKTFVPLGICGTAMGFGIACKWTGVYAGAGLAVLFFGTLFRRYREYCFCQNNPTGQTGSIPHKSVIRNFVPHTRKTIQFCIVFFVLVPGLIYLLSYIPYEDYSGAGLLTRMLNNQKNMLSYHSNLDATHYFASGWQEWPVMVRPIWYYSNIVTETAESHLREGISAFGNPLVWWIGIPAFLHMLFLVIKKKDRTAVFLIIGYLAQYLPWFFVTRITFIYHYFPSVAFVVLMITHSLMDLRHKLSSKEFVSILAVYAIAVFGLFLLFYPVLSGQPVEADFVDKYLRWFDTWVLVAG